MLEVTQYDAVPADDGRWSRTNVLVAADTVADLTELALLPSKHCVCLIVWDAPDDEDAVSAVARAVLNAGAAYVCTFGRGCERVHDAVDLEIVTGKREPDTAHLIPTTWHDDGSVEDALWFALFTASPTDAYVATCRTNVVLTIGKRDDAHELRRDLEDPSAFSERILANVATVE